MVCKLLFLIIIVASKRIVYFTNFLFQKKLFEQNESLKAFLSIQNKIWHRYGAPQLNKNSPTNEKLVSKNISALVSKYLIFINYPDLKFSISFSRASSNHEKDFPF